MGEPIQKLGGMRMVGRPPVQREQLRARLQNSLVRDWRPGEWLPTERALADRHGVSRSAMREALQTVPELELVAMKGWRVRPTPSGRVGRVLHVRVLESANDVDLHAGLTQGLSTTEAEIIDLHQPRPKHEDAVPGIVAQRLRKADWLVLFSEYGIPPAWEDYCRHWSSLAEARAMFR